MISENDPYLTNIKMYSLDMNTNDSKHIEIDDRINLFILKVGEDLYTGWFYYINGNMPIETFTNSSLNSLVELGYLSGIISTQTAGSTYNSDIINVIDSHIGEDFFLENTVSSDGSVQQYDMPPPSYGNDEAPISSYDSYNKPIEINIRISKGENKMNTDDIFKSFSIGPSLQDFEEGKVKKSIDEAIIKLDKDNKEKFSKSFSKPDSEVLKDEKSFTTTQYATMAHMDSIFSKDKDDTCF